MNAFDILQARGFIYQTSDPDAVRAMLEQPRTCYTGFDPTGASLTAGHLVPIMQLAHLQRAGHRPIVLCGGGTAMIGDPSGKTSSRPILTPDEIQSNLEAQKKQLMRFLDFDSGQPHDAIVVNNADWLLELNYIEFLRDIGRHFSVNQMLTADVYRTRLESGENLSFLEFNYQLLQGYDWLHLFRTEKCEIQCAGSDQWANCLAGKELIRRLHNAETQVICAPLLTTASGQKMGKTERGAIWLDAERTSPYEFFQYFVNVDDRDVEKLLKLLTFLPLERIAELCAVEGAALREAKQALAYEITKLVHGEDAADEARSAAKALFGGGGDREAVPTTPLAASRLGEITVIEAFVEAGLAKSNSEVRRLITQGGAYVNEERVDDLEAVLSGDSVDDGEILLRAGKKRYHRLTVE